MPEYYLICKKCNGYYKLKESEHPNEFNSCSVCGGDLVLVNDIDEYYPNRDVYLTKKNRSPLIKTVFILIALCIITFLLLLPASIFSNLLGLHNSINHDHSFLGSNSMGYVTKDVYSHYCASGPKIAIITGMHPREISAKTVVPNVIKSYAIAHNAEIVNYIINVTSSPNDFTIGRHNGEALVAQYVVPDIEKSDYDLVIICHNHRQGYGSGYYIATPTMDAQSVNLAEAVHDILPDFNYYPRNTDEKAESTSINKVDSPIAATGTPVFVYEIPEWAGYSDVYSNSNKLINACFNFLNG